MRLGSIIMVFVTRSKGLNGRQTHGLICYCSWDVLCYLFLFKLYNCVHLGQSLLVHLLGCICFQVLDDVFERGSKVELVVCFHAEWRLFVVHELGGVNLEITWRVFRPA